MSRPWVNNWVRPNSSLIMKLCLLMTICILLVTANLVRTTRIFGVHPEQRYGRNISPLSATDGEFIKWIISISITKPNYWFWQILGVEMFKIGLTIIKIWSEKSFRVMKIRYHPAPHQDPPLAQHQDHCYCPCSLISYHISPAETTQERHQMLAMVKMTISASSRDKDSHLMLRMLRPTGKLIFLWSCFESRAINPVTLRWFSFKHPQESIKIDRYLSGTCEEQFA